MVPQNYKALKMKKIRKIKKEECRSQEMQECFTNGTEVPPLR